MRNKNILSTPYEMASEAKLKANTTQIAHEAPSLTNSLKASQRLIHYLKQ